MKNGISIVAFTAGGARLQRKLLAALGNEVCCYAPQRYCSHAEIAPLRQKIDVWAKEQFASKKAIVFIGAAGIAVRAIGPLAQSKGTDPAVITIDEKGKYVIPLLSGHLGGGNALALRVAKILKGSPVLTTATDVNGVFSPDTWASQNGCAIPELSGIKYISAALLEGAPVGIYSDFPTEGALPQGLVSSQKEECGIVISLQKKQVFKTSLWLVPKCVVLGIGCRKGAEPEALEKAVLETLTQNNIPAEALAGVASIALKAREPAILAFCEKYSLPLQLYTPQQLMEVQGSVSSSSFVQEITGVDNVCERAALADGDELLFKKHIANSVTVAASRREWKAVF